MSDITQFVDLHAHSTYSFLDGCNHPEDIAAKAKEIGRTAHAITDHGNVSAHLAFDRACREQGIKPIFGLEMYFTPSVESDRSEKRRLNTHMTVLAETNEGYHNLLKMVTESYRDGFYYRALVDEANVRRHSKGLIFLSGCLSSMLSRELLRGSIDRAVAMANYWRDMVGEGNYFLETQLFPGEDTRRVNEGLMRVSLATGIPMVVTSDVHMLDNSQAQQDNRRLLHCHRDGIGWEESHAKTEFTYADGYLMRPEELPAHAEAAGIAGCLPELVANTLAVAERCNVELQKSHFIEFPLPEGVDRKQYFYQLIREGAEYRGIDITKEPYLSRLLYEAQLIEDKGYVDYFLVVGDMVRWAKDNGILVGPARGSSAGSLVCWLLRITEVNPLEFGLMFERFIDVTRSDLPDIDIDFDMEKRHLVRAYMEEKYGSERVGMLGTFTSWKGKNSLDAVGKIFGVPSSKVATIKDLLIERSSADSRASFTLEDTFAQWPQAEAVAQGYPDIRRAALLEGQMKGWSTHACGFIISSRPLDEVCALYYKNDSDEGVTSVGYDGAEQLGLLKIDILGLKALTVLQECMDAIGMSQADLYGMPLDDEETLRGFLEQDVQGIFQFEGGAMRSVLSQFVQQISFIELAHINALSRPGPLHGGMTSAFINIRNGAGEPTKLHPLVDNLLDYTYGQVVYQEQILTIAQQVGLLSWADTNALRKAMSKKYGTEFFDSMRAKFIAGATSDAVGLAEPQAIQIWEAMITFGAWAFNISHAVSYSFIPYWQMWFKRHHPTEFYAASCRHENDDDRLRSYLMEFQRKGGVILPPHFNRSGPSWRAEGHMRMRAGFDAVKGIGSLVAERLAAHQPYEDADDLATRRVPQPTPRQPNRVALIANKTVMNALHSVGAFDDESANEDFLGLDRLVKALNSCGASHKIGAIQHADAGEMTVAGVLRLRNLRSTKEVAAAKSRRVDPVTGDVTTGAGYEIKRPDLDEFVNLHVEDDTGIIMCSIDRWKYPRFKDVVWNQLSEGDIVFIEGLKDAGYRRIRSQSITAAFKRMPNGDYVPFEDLAEAAS